ncbi:MAG: LamG-like jellyroll fold domain-containing protein, partial [Bacteroidales bacterium]
MKRVRFIYIMVCLLTAFQWGSIQAQQANNSQRIADVEAGLTYGESLFVISNYSCLNTFSKETASVAELLRGQVEGFYFYLKGDERSNQVVMRKPDGTFVPFVNALRDIKQSLDANPYQFVTLFLDFNVELDLTSAFADADLTGILFEYGQRTTWPALQEMKANEKRLVVFEVQEHVNSPSWLHPMNELVVHTDPDWGNSMNSVEQQEDKMKKNLTLFTGFKNAEAMHLRGGSLYETSRFTPYLVNEVRDTWINEGRVPNFIIIDKYGEWVGATMRNVRSFNLVYGAVVSHEELVNYVNWEGMNNATTGLFCFPLENGMEMMLSPLAPGYRVEPEKMYATGNQKRTMMASFNATPVNIDEDLELWLPFNGEMENASAKQIVVANQGVEFSFDTSHGQVAYFDNESKLNLPTSQDLHLRDHDFTVQVWFKIPKYEEGKQDYCIIGSKTSAYQQALHLLVRDKKPYMGFYNNDIEGRTTIEPNRWYNLTWRFNKQNGEQAIFVNGKLDAVATGRPGYMGSDSLYVGYTSINQSYYAGMIDNLAIWSRVLSEKEILGLSNQVIELQVSPGTPFWQRNSWLLTGLVVLVLAILAL